MCFDDLPESNEDDSPLHTALAIVRGVTGYCALLSQLKCTTASADGRKRKREYCKKYAASPRGKLTIKLYADRNRNKRNAYNAMRRALKNGDLKKGIRCEACSLPGLRLDGHHDDYAKPLEVRWLCRDCHKTWHRKNGKALNG